MGVMVEGELSVRWYTTISAHHNRIGIETIRYDMRRMHTPHATRVDQTPPYNSGGETTPCPTLEGIITPTLQLGIGETTPFPTLGRNSPTLHSERSDTLLPHFKIYHLKVQTYRSISTRRRWHRCMCTPNLHQL